jgi:tmRNA-binding protein
MVRIMESIRLEFQPNIKAKILELLSSFSSEELTIVQEDLDFDENKRKLNLAFAKIKNGTAQSYSLEELDVFLEKTISEYEN